MANPQKKTSPIVWFAIGSLSLGTIYYFYSEESPTGATVRVKKKPVVSTKKDDYLPIDYTAKFELLNLPKQDAFVPLVVRDDGKSVVPTMDGAIPSAFADGDGNWQYKGFATVNGISQGLLENLNTGEGVFVKSGEKWKSARVLTITRDSIVMQGTTGEARSVPIISEDGGSATASSAMTPLPIPNPITGTIGASPLGASPDVQPAGAGGRRGRGRGGRGGGDTGVDFSSSAAPAAPAGSAVQFAAPQGTIVIGQ